MWYLITAVLVGFLLFKMLYSPQLPKNKRRMSYFTEMLASNNGAMPSNSNVAPTTFFSILEFSIDEFPTKNEIAALLQNLVKEYKFRCYVETKGTSSVFVETDKIDIDHHLIDVKLKDAEFQDYLESNFNRQWIREKELKKPLWYCHRITMESKNMIIMEVHHCIADGLSMLELGGILYTDRLGNPATVDLKKFTPKASKSRSIVESIVSVLHRVYCFFVALIMVLGRPDFFPDSESPLHPKPFKLPKSHKLYTLPVIPLERIKQIKTAHRVSVNDVISCLIFGALERCFRLKKADPKQVRALLPFSFPRKTLPGDSMKNEWTLISTPVPLGCKSPKERLLKIQNNSKWFKTSGEPLITKAVQKLLYTIAGNDATVGASFKMMTKHTLVFTNVPTYESPIYFCGKMALSLLPVVTNILPQFSILSYDGKIFGSIVLDSEIVDGDLLVKFMMDELNELSLDLKEQ